MDSTPIVSAPDSSSTARHETSPATNAPHARLDLEELVAVLDGDVAAVRTSPLYMLGTFVVTIAMIVLPLIYVGLIAAVAYGVFLHATENAVILSGGGGGYRFRVLAYFGPLVIGLVVIFFMIKPLFIRPPKGPDPHSLDPQQHRRLFAYVERLSRLVRAPRPRRIDLDCHVNASASFRRGVLSMFGNDLVLTIGMPLVAGLGLRQLTGVLAHELGHFSQGGAMRLSYVIRKINHWFARVVYERDSFDVALENALDDTEGVFFRLILFTAKGCIWLTRRILWALMMVGHLISSFLLRQMEYDADRYEARVAGSEAFGSTAIRLHELGVAAQGADVLLGRTWSDRYLADDYPALVIEHVDRLNDDIKRDIRKAIEESETGWLDTHPSDRDRIRSARAEQSPGLIDVETDAGQLFEDFAATSRAVTRTHYASILGAAVDDAHLVPAHALLGRARSEGERSQALERFFQGRLDHQRLLFPGVERIEPAEDVAATTTRLKDRRDELVRLSAADDARFAEIVCDRLVDALRLGRAADEPADQWTAADGFILFLSRLEPLADDIQALRIQFENQVGLLQQFEQRQHDSDYVQRMMDQSKELYDLLPPLVERLDEIPYPLDRAGGAAGCGEYALPELPPADHPGEVANAAHHLLSHVFQLYFRVMAGLAQLAERAEQSVGLEPLPPLPEQEPPAAGDPHTRNPQSVTHKTS